MITQGEIQEALDKLYPSMYNILPFNNNSLIMSCNIGRYKTNYVISELELFTMNIDRIIYIAFRQQLHIQQYEDRDKRNQYKLMYKKLKGLYDKTRKEAK